MIDPIDADTDDSSLPRRGVGEIVPDFEHLKPLRPKVQRADYDRPGPTAPQMTRSRANGDTTTASNLRSSLQAAPTSLVRASEHPHKPTKFERALGMAKTVLPLVGKMLPLLEGNVVSAAANLMANRPAEVNLKPLEEAISHLQSDQRALSFHASEQKKALQRLEDEFAAVQEAVHRNAELQAELTEHVANLAKRTSSFMRLVVILLAASLLFTALLCVRIAYIIRF